nr:hypothetical protein [uncultured Jannaschia sp.]
MTQHVRADAAETGTGTGSPNYIVDRLSCRKLLPLGDEQRGKRILSLRRPAPDCPQFIAGDRLLATEAIFQPSDPAPRLCEADVLPTQRDGLGDANPVAEIHQGQKVVADPVAALLGRDEEPTDIRLTEVV